VVGPLKPERMALAEARAALILQRVPGVGDAKLGKVVEAFGSCARALAAKRDEFTRVVGSSAAAAQRDDAAFAARVDVDLAWCGQHGVTVRYRSDPRYPEKLAKLDNPPAVMFLLGDESLLERETVTIVGSRKATEYGCRVARDVAGVAVRHGSVVASGLALGIDGEAHRATLAAGGKTIAVLGSGLAHPHPRSHTKLFHEIARGGLAVSELLPSEPPLPQHFPRRNRTLAALAHVVVVVEAAEKSGALITADRALELGRHVLAVPGSIYAPNSRGTNTLLQDAAHPLVTPATLLDYLPKDESQRDLELPPLDAAPPPSLGVDALRVWGELEGEPRHVDHLAARAQLSANRTLTALSLLELEGWSRQAPGSRYMRVTQ
jgi:DNA processing protein